MTDFPFISIILPSFNEELYIGKCIESIIKQDYPPEKTELLIVDGMSTDTTREIISEYLRLYPFIRLIDNPGRIVSFALNKGIKESKGDIIFRLDAHCHYPENYMSRLVNHLVELDADYVGGRIITLPAKNTDVCKSIAICSSHKFGVGNSLFRIGTHEITEADTVPFGCFKRDIFDRIGLFDVDLIRNQDDEFNGRIVKNKGRIYLIPDVVVEYFARDSAKKLFNMFYQYGLFKPLVNKKLGSPATIRQFAPLIFVLGLIAGTVLSLIYHPFFYLFISGVVVYLSISVYYSTIESKKSKNLKLILLLPYMFFTIHFSYGWGYLTGIIRFWIFSRNRHTVKTNR